MKIKVIYNFWLINLARIRRKLIYSVDEMAIKQAFL
jgi:hypothetical protein